MSQELLLKHFSTRWFVVQKDNGVNAPQEFGWLIEPVYCSVDADGVQYEMNVGLDTVVDKFLDFLRSFIVRWVCRNSDSTAMLSCGIEDFITQATTIRSVVRNYSFGSCVLKNFNEVWMLVRVASPNPFKVVLL